MALRIKTNIESIVEVVAQGHVAAPRVFGVEVSHEGKPFQLPGTGGITLRPLMGDRIFGWEADHIEPGVSAVFGTGRDDKGNSAFNYLCCAGNEATLISGAAKGKKGRVLGHHGGQEHVIIDFPLGVMKKMTLDDKILVKACGQGLKLLDAPDVVVMNCDPNLLPQICTQIRDGEVTVPVAAIVPAEMMGSGLGSASARTGDYDIMTTDRSLVEKYKLNHLRFGDLVGIQDHHATWGWSLKKGAVTVGVVIHGDSFLAGHGPGTTTLLTSVTGAIKLKLSPKANLGNYFKSMKG